MTQRISIPTDISNYIGQLYYEYNASINLLNYLIKMNASTELLKQKIAESEQKNKELEMAKELCVNTYKPTNCPKKFSYEFNFFTDELIITPIEEDE